MAGQKQGSRSVEEWAEVLKNVGHIMKTQGVRWDAACTQAGVIPNTAYTSRHRVWMKLGYDPVTGEKSTGKRPKGKSMLPLSIPKDNHFMSFAKNGDHVPNGHIEIVKNGVTIKVTKETDLVFVKQILEAIA